LLPHPGFWIGEQRCAELLADGLAPFEGLAVDASFNLEQGVDPTDSFQRQGRDYHRLFALFQNNLGLLIIGPATAPISLNNLGPFN
jgi:hypothetical protein